MSGFLNDIKKSFSGSKQELDETGKAVLDIENKKRAITQASESERNATMSKINEEYRKIGETSYKLYAEGSFEIEKIVGMFEVIKDFYQTLDEKQAKLSEILGRYDEELKILRPAPPAGQGACPGCGTAYIPGEMLFCVKCGGKLPEKSDDTSEAEAASVDQSVCSSCNAVLVSGSVFCANCGNKV